MPLRSRRDLIDAYPHLGSEGAKPEGRAALIGAGSTYQVLDDAFDDPVVSVALETWSRNNTSMVRLAEAILKKGSAAARRDAIRERRLQQASSVAPDLYGPGDDAKWVDRQLHALDVMARSGRAFAEFERIYRGAAMRSDQFDAMFQPGRPVHWRRLTACTLDPEFTPIHYAWKQRAALVKAEPPGDVTSYIIDIRLEAHPLPLLIWTGAVVGQYDISTYRWQAEVVTPPGFEFKVTSVNDLNPGSPDRLVVVQAEYVPPVT